MLSERLNNFIETKPKESLKMVAILVFLIWQSLPTMFGIILYLLLQKYKVKNLFAFVFGIVLTGISILIFRSSLFSYLHLGFLLNEEMWKFLFGKSFVQWENFSYFVGIPFLLSGILEFIELIPENPHKKTILALNQASEHSTAEWDDKKVETALNSLNEKSYDGIVLGVSKYTGKPLIIPDRDVNQVVLVLGTTGAGKTITLRRFYQRAILKGYPLVIVDGKPDVANIDWIRKLAEQHGRPFIGFNCANYLPYDPLANGGFTELKDKIISLKDEWSSDYYRSIAEDYLQTTLEVLLKSNQPFDLRRVVDCLNYDVLCLLVREIKNSELEKKVKSLAHYDRKDITGLQAHLNILIHSELGQFFEKNESTFSLPKALQDNAVVYFALPALRFPSFSKVLGKLVINDLKAVIDRNAINCVFTVFDEFSVFAGEQVLNLVNMGRGKGVHAIFGTQGLADLDKVDTTFKNQVLNCVNTLICHRLNDKESAETIANWVGTKDAYTVTAQLNLKESGGNMGSVRRNKEFIIHPDQIKQELRVGEAFWISKVEKFKHDKIVVRYAKI